jgi:hypothetical protein
MGSPPIDMQLQMAAVAHLAYAAGMAAGFVSAKGHTLELLLFAAQYNMEAMGQRIANLETQCHDRVVVHAAAEQLQVASG